MCTGAMRSSTRLLGLNAKDLTSTGMIKLDKHLKLDNSTTSHMIAADDISGTGVKETGRAVTL